MIQDISPHVLHNQFQIKEIQPDDFLLLFNKKNNILLKEIKNELSFLRFKDFPEGFTSVFTQEPEFLFSIDDRNFFMADYTDEMETFLIQRLKKQTIPSAETDINLIDFSIEVHPISIFRTFQPGYYGFAGITAHHIYRFRKSRAFCGYCGTPMEKSKTERAMICPNCKNVEYPKICPAVTVAIINKDKLLMAENIISKRFALIAGYVEIGESFEDTVRREVMEEVGLKIKNIRYYKSQPWAFSETAMVGFFAELDGDEHFTLDRSELSKAKWVTREEIPDYPTTSLTFEMVSLFKKGQVPPYLLEHKIPSFN